MRVSELKKRAQSAFRHLSSSSPSSHNEIREFSFIQFRSFFFSCFFFLHSCRFHNTNIYAGRVFTRTHNASLGHYLNTLWNLIWVRGTPKHTHTYGQWINNAIKFDFEYMSQSISSFIFIKVCIFFYCGKQWFWLSGPIAHAMMGNIHHYSIEIEFCFWVFSFSISRDSHSFPFIGSHRTRYIFDWQRASVIFNRFHVHYVPQTIKNDFIFLLHPVPRPKCTIKLMQSHFRHKNDSSWQIIGLALALFRFISLRHFDLFFHFYVFICHSSLLSRVFPFFPVVHSAQQTSRNIRQQQQRRRKKFERNCIN